MDFALKNKILLPVAAIWAVLTVYFVILAFSGADYSVNYQAYAGIDAVRLDLLKATKTGSYAVKKDVFRPLVFVRPAATVVQPVVTEPVAVKPDPKVAVFAKTTAFMGYLESDKKSIFLSHGTEVFIVKAGDSIDAYEISEIASGRVVLKDPATGETAIITIAE